MNLKRNTKSQITLNDGLLIEPLNPAKQFFSAVFLKQNCEYKLVFSPDVSQSGIVFLTKTQNNFPVIRSREHESIDRWSDTEYVYSTNSKSYTGKRKQCFRTSVGIKAAVIKCDS
jgi:hypothetical protein